MEVRILSEEERAARRRAARRRKAVVRLLVAIALGVALRLFVFEVAIVEGGSMEPTLLSGDHVLVVKHVRLKRFDVVVLTAPKTGGTIIKRIVGLRGETVSMVPRVENKGGRKIIVGNGQLYINHVPYDEPYAVSHVPTVIAPWTTRPDRYYVLGDNRDVSVDSRSFGGVSQELIHGVAYAIIWPLSRAHIIPRNATRE